VSAVFLKVVNMSLTASWLLLAILVLRPFLKKVPKRLWSWVWAIAAVRLVLPLSRKSILSLIPVAEPVAPDIAYHPVPMVNFGVESVNRVVNPIVMESFTPQAGASMNPLQIWIPIGAILWLVGIAALLLWLLISSLSLKRRVADAVCLQDKLFQSEKIRFPFVFGFFRPKIYLPYDLSATDTAHITAHENEHIRRGDHRRKILGYLILCVHWFNPLVWLCYHLFCRDMELACDEAVVKNMDAANRADYAQALLNCAAPKSRRLVCPLAFGQSNIKTRIKSVLHYKKPKFWLIVLCVVLCIVLCVCFLTDPKGEYEQTYGDTVDWAFSPMMSATWHYVFSFDVTMPHTHIEASCSDGMLWNLYEEDQPQGKHLTFYGDSILGWSPDFPQATKEAEVDFVVYDGENQLYSGTILIQQTEKTDAGQILYQARLVESDGLVLLALDDGAALVRMEDLEVSGSISRYVDVAFIGTSDVGYETLCMLSENAHLPRRYGNVEKLCPVFRIESVDDLENFIRALEGEFSTSEAFNAHPSFDEQCAGYNDDFFRESTLFLVYIEEPSSSISHMVEDVVVEDGAMDIRICRIAPTERDEMMAGWLMSVAVNRQAVAACDTFDAYICAEMNPDDTFPKGELIAAYRFEGESMMESAAVRLYDSGEFTMTFSPASSYLAYGTYVQTEDRLVLHTDDGKLQYCFDVTETGIVFDGELSSKEVFLSGLQDGSVLEKLQGSSSLPVGTKA